MDGNKRAGHAAMEVFLVLNGFEIQASVEKGTIGEQGAPAPEFLVLNPKGKLATRVSA